MRAAAPEPTATSDTAIQLGTATTAMTPQQPPCRLPRSAGAERPAHALRRHRLDHADLTDYDRIILPSPACAATTRSTGRQASFEQRPRPSTSATTLHPMLLYSGLSTQSPCRHAHHSPLERLKRYRVNRSAMTSLPHDKVTPCWLTHRDCSPKLDNEGPGTIPDSRHIAGATPLPQTFHLEHLDAVKPLQPAFTTLHCRLGLESSSIECGKSASRGCAWHTAPRILRPSSPTF